jgi:hypothetical protein
MMTTALSFPNLRRFAGAKSTEAPTACCHLCAATVSGDHRHMLEVGTGRLWCSCHMCWLLFADPQAGGGRLRALPDRVTRVSAAAVPAAQWEALQIPIALVFFRFSSATGRATAFYPSPAGAIESQLPLDAWLDVVDANPWLESVAPEVEAVLVRGTPEGRSWYIVPIDACYELIGRIRTRWEGLSGGDRVRDEINRFFTALDTKSSPLIAAGEKREARTTDESCHMIDPTLEPDANGR